MKSELKKLWEMRFAKLVSLEKEAFVFYKELLRENANLLEGTRARSMLKGIMKDEARHIKMARELLELVRKKKLSEKREEV